MTDLTNRWYQNVRVSPVHSDDENDEEIDYLNSTQIEMNSNWEKPGNPGFLVLFCESL